MPKRKRPEEEFLADLRPLKRRLSWREALERIYQEYPKGCGLERGVIASGLKSIYSAGKLNTKVNESNIDNACRSCVSKPKMIRHLFLLGKEYHLITDDNEEELFQEEEVDKHGNYVDEDYSSYSQQKEEHYDITEEEKRRNVRALSMPEAAVFVLKKKVGEFLSRDEILNRIRECVKSGEIVLKSRRRITSTSVGGAISLSVRNGYIYFEKYAIHKKRINQEKLNEWRKRNPKSNCSQEPKYVYFVKEVKPKQKEFARAEACVYALKKSNEEALISREIFEKIEKYEKSGEIHLKKGNGGVKYISKSLSFSVQNEITYFRQYRIKRRKLSRKKRNQLKRKYGTNFNKFQLYRTKYEFFLEEINDFGEEEDEIRVSAPPSTVVVPRRNEKGTTNRRKRKRRRKKKKKPNEERENHVKKEEENENEETKPTSQADDNDFDSPVIKIKKEEYDEDEDDDEAYEDEQRRLALSGQPLPFFEDEEE